ncbi:FERM domain-containing protein 6 isoform X2 [Triplophysa dalaica]|uniref:FERM domain-containing protein 6 isoform X2 n=1 Tax=Triplophysa dalaica TaxID=1582913 RepID=UPI0024E01788|nr:FERM domain-containing protein 6 isoform X2 [Triplophysa dalaica]
MFGLTVVRDNQPLFLDLEQKLSMYLPKSWRKNILKEKVVMYLKVQYFADNYQHIVNDDALKLYYAEVKARVLISRCYEQEGFYFQLAAYALQVELGDSKQGNNAYFQPQEFLPVWVIQRRGKGYILEHTPALHWKIAGMSSRKATQLFIQNAFILSDVPVTIYTLFKGKREKGRGVLLGLARTGLQIFEMLYEEQEFRYDLAWSCIYSIKFQGRKFETRADGMQGRKLVFYSVSVLHAKHLLQHISNSHRLHLNTKHTAVQFKATNDTYREMYITDQVDMNMDDSDDELPPIKFLLANMQNQSSGPVSVPNSQDCGHAIKGSDITQSSCGLEMSVDEPVETLVDSLEDLLCLVEQEEGVSVDDTFFHDYFSYSMW